MKHAHLLVNGTQCLLKVKLGKNLKRLGNLRIYQTRLPDVRKNEFFAIGAAIEVWTVEPSAKFPKSSKGWSLIVFTKFINRVILKSVHLK